MCILQECENITNLVDTRDRLGSISLYGVSMSEREDVAKFLCNHSDTCLDIVEGSGISIRQLIRTNAAPYPSKVSQVLKKHTTKQVIN